MLAGSVGSDFSEEFKLPASDSQEAFDLLENKFPAQSGDTATDRLQGRPAGSSRAAVKQKMEGVFAEVEKFPHVSEVASPYAEGRRRRGQRGRQDRLRDGPVRRHQQQARQRRSARRSSRSPRAPAATASRSSSAASRSRKPGRRRSGDSSFAIGLLAAVVDPADHLRLGGGDGAADHHRAVRARGRAQPGHRSAPTSSTPPNFAPQLAAMIGLGVGIDYALFIVTRFRNGLDEGPGAARRRRSPRSTPPAAPCCSPASP